MQVEGAGEPFQLYARSAVLMDADSGRVLFGKEEDVVRPMASTTKIMTCILALEHHLDAKDVTVSKLAQGQPEVRLGVREGETYHGKDLLYSMMLESHNDSAVVIAENTAGSVEDFARMMNEKAKELGCQQTYFVTPNGLDGYDEGGTHSTTARDLAQILRYCIKISPQKDAFLNITRTPSYQFADVSGRRSFSCQNHNAFLGMMEGALTGKTGFTADAGYCYVGALESGGRTFIVALLACGWPNNKSYKWADTKQLMQYGIDHYRYQEIPEGNALPDVSVIKGIPDHHRLSGPSTVTVSAKPMKKKVLMADTESLSVKTDLPKSLQAPIRQGETVGVIRYFLGDTLIGEQNIVADTGVEKRTFSWCMRQVASGIFL